MKKILFFLLLALLAGRAYGQRNNDFESLTLMADKDDIAACGFVRSAQPPVDTSRLRVVYRLIYRAAPDAKPRETEWLLAIGARHTDFRSCAYARADTLASASRKGGLPGPMVPFEPLGEVLRSIAEGRFEVLQRIPFERRHVVRYDESAAAPEWRMLGRTDTVGGYLCHAAATTYGGREWTAWFAPAVPTDAGPWKLFGLPGLILRAGDATGSYAFEPVKIEQAAVPMPGCGVPIRTESKRKWLRMECGFHGSPAFYFSAGGKHLFYMRGSKVPLGGEWRITYNPVEFDMAETEKPVE